MILECPNCQNRYLVDPRAIGENGRIVRCAKCRHEWFAEASRRQPDNDVINVAEVAQEQQGAPESATRPAAFSATLPALVQPRGVPLQLKLATAASAVFFVICSLFYFHAAILRSLPSLEPVYAAFGIYNSEGVVLAGLEYHRLAPETEGSLRDNHVFSGSLVNTSAEGRRLPRTLIVLKGREDSVLRRQPLVSDAWMQPGEAVDFRVPLSTSPESLHHVVIELGSPFELKQR